MLYHSTEKPFLCEVSGCGQAFSLKGNLKKHAKIHQQKQNGDTYDAEPVSTQNWQDVGFAQLPLHFSQGLVQDGEFQQDPSLPFSQFSMQQIQFHQQMMQQQYLMMYRNHVMQSNQIEGGLLPLGFDDQWGRPFADPSNPLQIPFPPFQISQPSEIPQPEIPPTTQIAVMPQQAHIEGLELKDELNPHPLPLQSVDVHSQLADENQINK
jgi:hypothetical protein